jgi:CubicO group peptidase (beta-lactamase class C family)
MPLLTLGLALAMASTSVAEPARVDIPRLMHLGDIPGLAIAVVRADTLAWSAAHGVRNAQTRADVDDDTVFEAASLSKTLFAYVTLRLADRGVIDLDTPLVRYATYPRLADDPRHRDVTARMCLTHTSGLPNWGVRFVAEPGSRFIYSGEGIRFLRKTLEAVTGRSLEDLARREAFDPLGMTRSSYLWTPELARNRASGHDAQGSPQPRRRCPGGSAAASLHTTARDYARFLAACLAGEGLSDEMHAEMLRTQTPAVLGSASGMSSAQVGWGLGWGTMAAPVGERIWQWGDNGDTVALAVGDPASGDGFVYLANSATGLSIAHALHEALLTGRPWCLDALGYQRHDGPARVHWLEARARKALRRGAWRQATERLHTLLELRPGHAWAARQLHALEVQRAQRDGRGQGHG